jgi:hypothetical protein
MRRGRRGGPRPAAGAAAVALVLAAGACSSPGPSPTTPASSVPSASRGTPNARCLADGRFLIDAATAATAVLTTLNATERTGADLQTAISAAEAERAVVLTRTVHPPFVADRALLLTGLEDIIQGLSAEAAAPNRAQIRIAQHQTSKGSGEVSVSNANALVGRERC